MSVSPVIWTLTIALILGLLVFDYVFHVRKAHIPTIGEAAQWTGIYQGIALLFGITVFVFGGSTMGTEFFAGWVTELALSVDNLFVFLIILGAFAVPREDQQKVLLFGIAFAIIARGGMIAIGAVAIEHLSFAFYIFGAFLLYTAIKMIIDEVGGDADEDEEAQQKDGIFVRLVKKVLPASDEFDGDKLFTIENGKRVLTPMLLVMVAIGGTDLLFALDSIPAIFGLTQTTYIVFTATAFSLLGLRQMFFLIDGLLDRLVYLSYGLSIILAFIGVKLVLHALHENELPFINGGEHVNVPEVSTGLSLAVIIVTLTVTVLFSLLSPKGRAQAAVNNAHREAVAYVEMTYQSFEDRRDEMYENMLEHERIIERLPAKFQDMVVADRHVVELLADAHAVHSQRLGFNERGERSDEQPEGLVVTRPDGLVAKDANDNVITVAEQEKELAKKEGKRLERERARAAYNA